MHVPNNQERKSGKGANLLPALFFSILIFFSFSVLCSVFAVPASADQGKLSVILIEGDEIYVRSGNYYAFLQGYQIYVKGADTEGDRVWIELRRNGIFLEDAIVSEGSTFVYSNNSTEILNLTVDTIYSGADGVLVKFSPVYQYLNPRLPMPQKSEAPPTSDSDNNSPSSPVFENQAEGFDVPLFLLGLGSVLMVTGFFAGRYKKK